VSATPFWGGGNDPGDEARAWDFCWLGDDLLPGIVEDVEVTGNGRDVDKQKAKGEDGVTLKDNGVGSAQITITLRLWDPEHHASWQEVRRRIDPKNPGGLRAPLTITHPRATEEGIKGVYVERIDAQHPSAVSGRTIVIECSEWFPAPKPAKTSQKQKPTASDRRQGLPGEAITLNAIEGIDGIDFGPEPRSRNKDIGVDAERIKAAEAARKAALDKAQKDAEEAST
jgi:hypothetical protein